MITSLEAVKIFETQLKLIPQEQHIRADRDYPPFDRVMMDGIAIQFSALEKNQKCFKVQGISRAGIAPLSLKNEDYCLEVMTGSVLPHHADTVIPYEHLEIHHETATIIKDEKRVKGLNVHKKGSDCLKGDTLLTSPFIHHGPHVGILSSVGEKFLSLKCKIMLISTGDELVEREQIPRDHELRRSNIYALETSLRLFGYQNITHAHLRDDQKMIYDHYQKYVKDYDLIIYSGGVSKGKFDYLPSVWSDLGVTRYISGVSQRPGKPLWFGQDEKHQTFILGLPGNPVSSLVCLHRYLLNRDQKISVELKEDIIFKPDLTFFVPVKLNFEFNAKLTGTPLSIKNSGEFTALAYSDGFIELPRDKDYFKAGEVYPFFSWRPM
jgi:molybdopterin molybdotransferase